MKVDSYLGNSGDTHSGAPQFKTITKHQISKKSILRL